MGGSPTLIHILIMKEEESKSKNINTTRKAQKNLPRRLKKSEAPESGTCENIYSNRLVLPGQDRIFPLRRATSNSFPETSFPAFPPH
jgi:hypothetical protein